MELSVANSRAVINEWLASRGREPIPNEVSDLAFAHKLRQTGLVTPDTMGKHHCAMRHEHDLANRWDAYAYLRYVAKGLNLAVRAARRREPAAERRPEPREQITVALDHDVALALRGLGRGWLQRVNDVLRAGLQVSGGAGTSGDISRGQ